MRMLIVGAGAIGGYYGGRLAAAGRDVTFLVRPARAQKLRVGGLQIKSPNGDVSIAPRLVTADAIDGPYDAIFLAVKGYTLDAALTDMAPALGRTSMILAPLNGMKHIDIISARFGAAQLLGCICKIVVDLDDQGRILHLNPQEDMAYGEMDGHTSPRLTALDAFMQNAGFNARISNVIGREMWEKWLLLAGLGGINALMRGSIGEVQAASGGPEFVNAYLDEITGLIEKVGIAPSPEFETFARNLLTAQGLPMTSSMYRDLQKGGAVEADQIIGDLLARGGQAGIATPLLSAVYANLCVYQNRLRQS